MIVLDLFSGGGGAGMGYHQAGHEVIGIDIAPTSYPFEFHQMDWLDGLDKFGEDADLIHASPPCQRYSCSTLKASREDRADLVDHVRLALQVLDKPYVIENVATAPLWPGLMLCGSMFGLTTEHNGQTFELRRHRNFEFSYQPPPQPRCKHRFPSMPVFGHSPPGTFYRKYGGGVTQDTMRTLMGADWMTGDELSESIPPAYTRYIAEWWQR